MDTTDNFLKSDDVLSCSESALMFQCTFKVSEFLTIMQTKLQEEKLFSEDGLDCELLSPGKTWKKGKLKFRLEFCPEEPEPAEPTTPNGSAEPETPLINYGPVTEPFPVEPTDNLDSAVEPTDDTDPAVESPATSEPDYPLPVLLDGHPKSLGMWS